MNNFIPKKIRTLAEFLDSTYCDKNKRAVRKRAVCADGFTFSVQGYGFSTDYLDYDVFEHVKITAPDGEVPELAEYLNEKGAFWYVPFCAAEDFAAKHGGIVRAIDPVELGHMEAEEKYRGMDDKQLWAARKEVLRTLDYLNGEIDKIGFDYFWDIKFFVYMKFHQWGMLEYLTKACKTPTT